MDAKAQNIEVTNKRTAIGLMKELTAELILY